MCWPADTGLKADGNPDWEMMGFKRGFQWNDLVSTARLLIERAVEWSVGLVISQIAFARAYDVRQHPPHSHPAESGHCDSDVYL